MKKSQTARTECSPEELCSRHEIVMQNSRELIQSVRPDGSFDFVNKSWLKTLGYTRKELQELKLFDIVAAEFKKKCKSKFKNVLDGRRFGEIEAVFMSKKGERIYLKGTICPRKENGRVTATLGFFSNVTARKKTEEMLEASRERYKTIYNSTDYAFMVVTPREGFLSCNRATLKMFGCRNVEEFTSRSPADFSPRFQPDGQLSTAKAQKMMKTALKKGSNFFEWTHKRLNGREFFATVLLNKMTIDGRDVLLATVQDITREKKSRERLHQLNEELKKYNKKLQKLSLIDSHTGLYNHRYMAQTLDAEFLRAKRAIRPLSVIMFDIDYFKSINDVYGHKFGDLVLKQFSKFLKDKVRKYDTVSRFGGEEFVIISPGSSRVTALNLARRIINSLAMNSFGNADTTIKLKISGGVASYPEDEVGGAMDLVETADRIMAHSKEDGGRRAYSSLEVKAGLNPEGNAPEKKLSIGNLKSTIKKLSKRSNQSLVEAIFAFAKTLKMKDPYTGEHVEETVQYATKIAKAMKLSPAETERIRQAAILHDLGKVGVRGSILRKRSGLTEEEFDEIKKHPQIAADILRGVHFMHDIIPLILRHHEWWNGKGYPDGVKGKDIPLGARIIAVADVYQSLISTRTYSPSYTKKQALKIIEKAAGTQFDPAIVKVFLKAMKSPD